VSVPEFVQSPLSQSDDLVFPEVEVVVELVESTVESVRPRDEWIRMEASRGESIVRECRSNCVCRQSIVVGDGDVRILTSQQRGDSLTRVRTRTVSVFESDALRGEFVDDRGGLSMVSVAREVVSTKGVGRE
jgi:hypothetical protein